MWFQVSSFCNTEDETLLWLQVSSICNTKDETSCGCKWVHFVAPKDKTPARCSWDIKYLKHEKAGTLLTLNWVPTTNNWYIKLIFCSKHHCSWLFRTIDDILLTKQKLTVGSANFRWLIVFYLSAMCLTQSSLRFWNMNRFWFFSSKSPLICHSCFGQKNCLSFELASTC
jgi:hypothetical protein